MEQGADPFDNAAATGLLEELEGADTDRDMLRLALRVAGPEEAPDETDLQTGVAAACLVALNLGAPLPPDHDAVRRWTAVHEQVDVSGLCGAALAVLTRPDLLVTDEALEPYRHTLRGALAAE